MIKKTTFVLIVLTFLSGSVISKKVSLKKARQVAVHFYTERFSESRTPDENLLPIINFTKGETVFYVFNIKDERGFIIVSGDEALPPVPGYSFEGNFSTDDRNDAFDFWMEGLGKYARLRETGKYKAEWEKYLSGNGISKDVKGVAPLLTIAWAQGCYYNSFCPVDSAGSCYHAKVGCGATAMSMVLKYWNYPEHGYGSNAYENPPYGTLYADFENTFYDWENMPPTLNSQSTSEQVHAVAQLMYHCGVAVNMVYTAHWAASDDWNIRNAFTDHFGYSSNSLFLDTEDFSGDEWTALMQAEADAGRPVFYGISGGSGGHFIVMDGYQDDQYFHYNWGNGSLNGYYKTFAELPFIQQAIIHLYPNSETTQGNENYFAYNQLFNDGSNTGDYPNGKSFQWLIHPQDAQNIVFLFTRFSTEYQADFVNIYDGSTTASPLLGHFSGHQLPPVLQTSSNQALVEFVTDAVNTDKGWELRYTTVREQLPCSGITVFDDSTATFDDGSGAAKYREDTDCFWLINPGDAGSVTLHFDNFNTEAGWDFLYVYNGENPAPDQLLATLTGNISPTDIRSTCGKMLLHFHTDWNTNRPGWQVSYTANYEKIRLKVRVFLQGAFESLLMNTGINGILPVHQPFDTDPSAICYYEGMESVDAIPNENIVDWMLVELYDAADVESVDQNKPVARQAVFLRNDSYLVALDGFSTPVFFNRIVQQPFIRVLHRNHLPLLSAQPLVHAGATSFYDFTDAADKALGGEKVQVELAPGIWGPATGDANADGQVNNKDKDNIWFLQNGQNGYFTGDFDMNGTVDEQDNDLWKSNAGKGRQDDILN